MQGAAQRAVNKMAENGIQRNGGAYKRKAEFDVLEVGTHGSFGLGDQAKTSNDMYTDKLDIFSPSVVEEYLEYFR